MGHSFVKDSKTFWYKFLKFLELEIGSIHIHLPCAVLLDNIDISVQNAVLKNQVNKHLSIYFRNTWSPSKHVLRMQWFLAMKAALF